MSSAEDSDSASPLNLPGRRPTAPASTSSASRTAAKTEARANEILSMVRDELKRAEDVSKAAAHAIDVDAVSALVGDLAALRVDDAAAKQPITRVQTPPPVVEAKKAPLATPAPKQRSSAVESKVKVGLVYDERMEAHEMVGHFECPARHRVVVNEIKADGLAARCVPLCSREATDAELLRAHDAAHVAAVQTAFDPEGEPVQVATVDDDTGNDIFYTKDTSFGARMAAGCVTEACEAVLRGDVQRAFAVVRPPGHHALCARAMGFCFFNNAVVAARAALEREEVQRVMILDWDVHHGNGIQDLTLEDDTIMYVSLHRYGDGFYPGTGAGEEVGKNGTNINVGWLEKGLGDADYLAAFDIVIEPIARSFAPDLIIIAAGFDAADGDPLGGMMLSPTGYEHMTRRLCDIGSGRVVIALEGGYALRPLATCASASLRALLGDAPRAISSRSRPRKTSVKLLTDLAASLAPYWPALKSEEYSEKVRAILKHTTVVASRRVDAYPTGRRSSSMSSSATAV